jgi:glutathione S-transferase
VAAGADLLLRAACAKLLRAGDNPAPDPQVKRALTAGGALTKDQAAAVKASVSYLMVRVGVPRDMAYPAARQLRAHLNWATEQHLP